MAPMGFKILVPVDQWVPPIPAVTTFDTCHDARIQVENGLQNTSVSIRFEFSALMDCNSVSQSMSFNLSSSSLGGTAAIDPNSVQCLMMDPSTVPPAEIPEVAIYQWYWTARLTNVADGIVSITINNPKSQSGVGTGVSHFAPGGC